MKEAMTHIGRARHSVRAVWGMVPTGGAHGVPCSTIPAFLFHSRFFAMIVID